MKQHITIDQLNELTRGQKERLRGWWKPDFGDWFFSEKGKDILPISQQLGYTSSVVGRYAEYKRDEACPYDVVESGDLPLLSIGQMIEFIKSIGIYDINITENWRDFPIEAGYNDDYKGWEVELERSGLNSLEYWSDDLCDALWEAVKYILSKDK